MYMLHHVLSEKKHKLQDIFEKRIFLGHSSLSKGYRVRDVFSEDVSWDWEHNDIKKMYVVTQPSHSSNSLLAYTTFLGGV